MKIILYKSIEEMNAAGFLFSNKTYQAYLQEALSFLKKCKAIYLAKEPTAPLSAERLHRVAKEQLEVESLQITAYSWRKLRRSLSVLYYSVGAQEISDSFAKLKYST